MNLSGKYKGQNYFNLFDMFYSRKYKLVVSTHVLFEIRKFLKYHGSEDDFVFIENMIWDLKKIDNVLMVGFNDSDKERARELDSTNYPDALHVILAIKNNCEIIVTENIKDFKKYNNLIKILHPTQFH